MNFLYRFIVVIACAAIAGCVSALEDAAHTLNYIGEDANGNSAIYGVSLQGRTEKIVDLGDRFGDGLAWNPMDKRWYAVDEKPDGTSVLVRVNNFGAKSELFILGDGYDRGLTYRNNDQRLYALVASRSRNFIVRIEANETTTPLFEIGSGFHGLTYDPVDDLFYSIRTATNGHSTLFAINMAGTPSSVASLGQNFTRGVAYHPGREVFFALARSDDEIDVLYQIQKNGRVFEFFGVGPDVRGASATLAKDVPGPGLWRHSPIRGERFVVGEEIEFSAAMTQVSMTQGYEIVDASEISWSSDRDGPIGNGAPSTSMLSVGAHTITYGARGLSQTVDIRVMPDLDALYAAEPSPSEISRTKRDFRFRLVDGPGNDEQWAPYKDLPFDQDAIGPQPSRVWALLDVLRHQKFAEPLPMTNGQSIYEHIRLSVPELLMYLDCGSSSAGSTAINLRRNLHQWKGGGSGTGDCKSASEQKTITPYVFATQLFVHEARHLQIGDPKHVNCTGGAIFDADQRLQPGSGYTWAALYQMWVYKYGLHDSSTAKQFARSTARSLLTSRFCEAPTHTNPKVQAIIDEVLASN